MTGNPNKCKNQHEVSFEMRVCEKTCSNRLSTDPTEICQKQSQCVCADGFYRSDNNVCVSGDQCDVCKVNGKTYKVIIICKNFNLSFFLHFID